VHINELSQNDIEIDWSLAQYMNYIPALMWVSRADGLATYFNQNWLKFVGRDIKQEIGNGWADNVHPDDFGQCLSIYTEAVRKQQCCTLEFRLKRHDGEYRWILDNIVTRFSKTGKFLGFIGTCLDVTDQHIAKKIIEKQRDELAYIVMHDYLTDAFNRRYLFEYAELEIKRCKRYEHPLHLLMIDVDKFKNINDTFGHNIGDEVLYSLVKCINEKVRPFDMVCRYAGDEFCIILPETNQQGAYEIAERIRAGAEKITLTNADNLTITLSIGIAEYKEIFSGIEDWIFSADSALYKAKEAGRNGICVSEYEPGRPNN
jgi:diguanylate cyclase (GGDEF)-like protein/PAS domain S-box-containing protein